MNVKSAQSSKENISPTKMTTETSGYIERTIFFLFSTFNKSKERRQGLGLSLATFVHEIPGCEDLSGWQKSRRSKEQWKVYHDFLSV